MGPNEYRKAIIPLCEETGIQFLAIDYFEEEHINLKHFALFSEKEQENLTSILMEKYEKMFEMARKDSIPFNSYQLNKQIEEKQEWLREINRKVQSII